MVSNWLRDYMFAGDADATGKSDTIAKWFADYDEFQSHGRRVGTEKAIEIGLKVTRLEADSVLQDAMLSVHHSAMHVFSASPTAVKIIENHHGQAYIRNTQQLTFKAVPAPSQGAPPGSNRAERRRSGKGKR